MDVHTYCGTHISSFLMDTREKMYVHYTVCLSWMHNLNDRKEKILTISMYIMWYIFHNIPNQLEMHQPLPKKVRIRAIV